MLFFSLSYILIFGISCRTVNCSNIDIYGRSASTDLAYNLNSLLSKTKGCSIAHLVSQFVLSFRDVLSGLLNLKTYLSLMFIISVFCLISDVRRPIAA